MRFCLKPLQFLTIAIAPFSLASCGLIDDDPLAQGREAFENHVYGDARIYLRTALQENPASAEAQILFAKTMLALGDGLTAQTALAKVSEGDAASPQELRNLKAEALLLQGKANEAQTLLNETVAEWDAQSFVIAARASVALGDFDRAASFTQNGIKAYAVDAELLALDAAISIEQGRLTPAKQSAQAALKADGNNLSALLINGQLAQFSGDQKGAKEFYDKALENNPDSRLPLLSLAAIQADSGEYDQALRLLDRADNLYTIGALSAYLRARIYVQQGDVQAAYNLMQEAEKELQDHPPSVLLAGEIAAQRKNFNRAEERLTRFLALSPRHKKGTLLLVDVLNQKGDVKAAAELLSTISGRADMEPGLLKYAADIYKKAGLTDQAALMTKRANVPDNQKLAELAVEAGRAQRDGKDAIALAKYQEAIAGGLGNSALVRNNAAFIALKLGKNAEAITNARAAFALTPDDPSVRDTLAWVLLKTGGDKSEALKHLEYAAALRPSDIEVRWHLANALVANGRIADARKELAFMRRFASASQKAELQKLSDSL